MTSQHQESAPSSALSTPTAHGGRTAASASRSRAWANVLTYAFLLAAGVIVLAPFLFSVMTSLKTPRQFNTTWPLTLPDPWTIENYTALFGERYDFVVPIAVTAQVVVVLVLTQMLTSVLAAYAFAVLDFPGRDALFWVYVACLMIPAVVIIIPLYSMMTSVGLKNTFAGLVVPFLFAGPYAIFLLRENFRSVPTDILDAAKLDGAGVLRTLFRIMLPMNVPILTTLLLITVVTQWNNFMWPLVIAPKTEWNVITVATAALQTQYEGNWTLVMAASTIALLPLVILFLVFQRRITSAIGITGLR
ncbi:binding-protein-dependent transport systems inner membrane component [Beutenbergia cavernae DSM 12333]|uniref:Binding-protein-dependent transport systems inner membrane component n=1 Tax=Beutenbergia cavernae (strain ATCC BAA-8 / DSM 12333 / CCUG 43141 / JCM 11478 / NBRC 16432 / NCIMB 13614 / HKI 0122) TaxID=471853 RepID=C5BVH0_BEUC1|nr:carbohydrate ABC transporter permease [Beutenbergia cavernae]ACQ78410.1 binding-protein-dependent transport systems inner membrane component [Beutenbergia cavernae DSM 12333]